MRSNRFVKTIAEDVRLGRQKGFAVREAMHPIAVFGFSAGDFHFRPDCSLGQLRNPESTYEIQNRAISGDDCRTEVFSPRLTEAFEKLMGRLSRIVAEGSDSIPGLDFGLLFSRLVRCKKKNFCSGAETESSDAWWKRISYGRKPTSFWERRDERCLYSCIPERAARGSVETRVPMDEEVHHVSAHVRGGQNGRGERFLQNRQTCRCGQLWAALRRGVPACGQRWLGDCLFHTLQPFLCLLPEL